VSLANASYGPSAGNEVVFPFRVGRQTGPNPLAWHRSPLLVQRRRVGRRGRLDAQERRPLVFEVAEDGRYAGGTHFDLF
jgi:hypothetical protein